MGDDFRRALASSLQQACATIVTDLVEWFRQCTGARYLCLAGGVFQNALLVSALEGGVAFDPVFVPPASGNAGCALAAAWLLWNQVLGKPRVAPSSYLYSGPSYASEEIKHVLDNCKADTDGRRPKLAGSTRRSACSRVEILLGGFRARRSLARARWATGACSPLPGRLTSRRISISTSNIGRHSSRLQLR